MRAKPRKGKRMTMFGQVTVPPTPERMAKGDLRAIEVEMFNKRDMATLDLRASMLDRYWQDQLLAPEGDLDLGRARYDAGVKLAQLFEATGLRQRESGTYGPKDHGNQDVSDHPDACGCNTCRQLAALEAYNGVMRMLQRVSMQAASAVRNLCVYEFDPVDRRELICGLDLLVRHWGLD